LSSGPAGASLDAQSLARRLAPVLGDEGAEAAVREAARDLGYPESGLTHEEQIRTLEWLGAKAGLIGTAARRALHGFVLRQTAQARLPAAPSDRIFTPPPGPSMIDGSELVAIFARALGDEKARETIDAECKRLSLSATRLSIASALSLLDDLAASSGLVAVTARFAKARLALRR
jgi:hypothetical protein